MDPDLSETSSEGVISNMFKLIQEEMVEDRLGSNTFQKCMAYKEKDQNMVYVNSLDAQKENGLNCNGEDLTKPKNGKENNEVKPSDVYLSAGVYLHPLTFNGNYENIIELIDVDPNEKLDVGSPLPNKKTDLRDNNQAYDVAVGCLFPAISNNVVPFLPNYAATNTELQSLQMIYNTPSTSSNSPSENSVKKTVPPFLKRNRKQKSTTNLIVPKKESCDVNNGYPHEDDDVVFVKKWALEEKSDQNEANINLEATTSSSSSPVAPVKRRRRRRTFGEKRKNPVRKAQIDKASLDLAQKLAIPPSVFNARVKGRKPKQKVVVETKNLRQSCRTSGAILSPPRALSGFDYREWPVDGMHERPFYDQTTKTIIKYHIPNALNGESQCNNDRRPVLEENENKSEKCVKTKPKTVRRSSRRSSKEKSKEFAKLALDRFDMLFGYVQELKEFNKLTAGSKQKQSTAKKATVYEKSLEFRDYQNGIIKETNFKKKFSKITKGVKEENIKQVISTLYDTCTLYSFADGVTDKDVTELVDSYTKKGKKCVKPQK